MSGPKERMAQIPQWMSQGAGDKGWRLLRRGLLSEEVRSFEFETAGRFIAKMAGMIDGMGVARLSVAVLGGGTTEPIANAIRCAACMEDVWADVYEAPFGTFRQEVLDAHSALYAEKRDFVVMAVPPTSIKPFPNGDATDREVESLTEHYVQDFCMIWETIRTRLGCGVLQHTLESLGIRFIGSAESDWPASPDRFLAQMNARLRAVAPSFVRWVDTAALASQVGLENWIDPRLYFHGKYMFNPRYLDRYVLLLLGALRAMRGRSKKCLVTDLDNTLWGGVIGDDGMAGIELGSGSASGEGHEAFCGYLRGLSQRGIILAVCSKNEPAVARQVFDAHPGMPLKMGDFAAFHCGWDDKASALRQIAAELNIGTEHMVFVDDNPAECELVRQQLPEVGVVELSGDPSAFIRKLERGHWFDSERVSREDAKRAASYQGRRLAEAARGQSTDLGSYLDSLSMCARCGPATEADMRRLAQLEGKTNQFNLTTRRLEEGALRELFAKRDAMVLACSLRDRFADHGIVASAVLMRDGEAWRIDSWLMSCRVFSRTLEEFMLNEMVNLTKDSGALRLLGEYVATERNGVVRDLYGRLGFVRVGKVDSAERWELTLGDFVPRGTHVRKGEPGDPV